MRDALPQVVNTPELRFDCDDDRKFAVIEEVAARLRAEGAKVVGHRRRARADRRRLVAAARVQHPGGAGRAGGSQSAEGLSRLKAALATQFAASGLAPDFSATNAGH